MPSTFIRKYTGDKKSGSSSLLTSACPRSAQGNWPDQNAIQLCLVQNQSEERRREAQIRIATYQQKIKAFHLKKVKPCGFQVGDLILKQIIQSTNERNVGKLRPNWEGPYFVMAKGGNGSYTLCSYTLSSLSTLSFSFSVSLFYLLSVSL